MYRKGWGGNTDIRFEPNMYGLLIALGILAAVLLARRDEKRLGLPKDITIDLALWVVPLGVIGARLYYVLFRWEVYAENPISALYIWEGGLAIYGGIISGVLVAFVFCRLRHISFPAMLDVMSFGVLIGQALGRWGNFFNREAFGAETEIFCRMGLTAPDGTTVFVHPTFLYESLWNLLGLIFLIRFSRSGRRRYNGQIALMYFFWYGLGRSWIEGLRSDSLYLAHTGIRVSQLLSILIACVSGVILLINHNKKPAVGSVSAEQKAEPRSPGGM